MRYRLTSVSSVCLFVYFIVSVLGVKVAVALIEQILSDIHGDSDRGNVSQWEGRIEETFASLWHHNGNNLSRLFTGTTALHSSHTKSKLSDRSASVARFVKASQLEGVMQEGFDLLLGQTTFGIKSILTGNTLLGEFVVRQGLYSLLEPTLELVPLNVTFSRVL